MKTLGLFSVVLAVALSVAALAMQSPTENPPDIKTLADADAAIHELTLRVAALEARLEGSGADAASGRDAAAPSPGAGVLKVEAMETVRPTEETVAEAKAIQLEAENLDRQASSLQASASTVHVDNDDDADNSSQASARRQINSYKSQAAEAKRLAKQKRKEAESMLAPRQIIRGWSGKRSVEAHTERDLSAQLKGIAAGSYITADWTMVDMDDETATVAIRSIKKVAAPAGFVERPGGSRN